MDEDVGERGERWIAHGAAEVHLARGEAGVVVLAGELVDVVVGLVGLDEDASGFVAAAGAAGDLGEELEDALRSAEVWEAEGEVGADDADEGDAVDVVALGDHLRADEEIDFAGVQALEDAFHVAAGADGVAVHAADAGVGKEFLQAFFALLRACAEEEEVLAIALGAVARDAAAEAAVVALEARADASGAGEICFVRVLVVGERDGAVFALDFFTAGAAHDDERVAATVEEDDDLFAAVERGLCFFDELAGEELFLSGLAELGAHVDHFDDREWAGLHALQAFRCGRSGRVRRCSRIRVMAWRSRGRW